MLHSMLLVNVICMMMEQMNEKIEKQKSLGNWLPIVFGKSGKFPCFPPRKMSNRKCFVPPHSNQKTTNRKKATVDIRAFQTRYNNPTSSFRNPKHKHSTELSKYIWQLKQCNIEYSIRWKVFTKCKVCSNKTKRYNLSLQQKYVITYYPKLSALNSKKNFCSVALTLFTLPYDVNHS